MSSFTSSSSSSPWLCKEAELLSAMPGCRSGEGCHDITCGHTHSLTFVLQSILIMVSDSIPPTKEVTQDPTRLAEINTKDSMAGEWGGANS